MKKLFFLFTFSVLTLLIACNKTDSSNNPTPTPTPTSKCQNGGTLVNGVCECPFGYEGDYCDIESRLKFVGIFKGQQSYNGNSAKYREYEIKKTNGVTKIRIYGSNGGVEMEADLTDVNKIKIPKQEYVWGTEVVDIVGNGSLKGSTLTLNYSIKAQLDGTTLTYTFTGVK